VAAALADDRPVVALESTLLAHGLPTAISRDTAHRVEGSVRAAGAVPATVAVLDGACVVGLSGGQLDSLCSQRAVKLSRRDLGPALATGVLGATTVAATAAIAALAGISVFATGGLGGVHRGAAMSWDVSADLATLAESPVLVVCSGVKSILDIAATLELLESLSVPVLGYRTGTFPAFYLRDSGLPVPWRVDDVAAAAAAFHAHRGLGGRAGMVLANPVPAADQLAPELHDRLLREALTLVEGGEVRGKDITPRLLEHFHTGSAGASVHANLALVLANAELAGRVAVALTEVSRR
jgi:pseudouridine-5'-phosphate glycosidase